MIVQYIENLKKKFYKMLYCKSSCIYTIKVELKKKMKVPDYAGKPGLVHYASYNFYYCSGDKNRIDNDAWLFPSLTAILL